MSPHVLLPWPRSRHGSAPAIRFAAATAAGALAVLALPPFSVPPVLFAALGVLFSLTVGAGWRAFFMGFGFGLGFFGFGLSWIAESFFVDAERFGWMAMPAVTGLSAFLALFPAVACALFGLSGGAGVRGAVLFATSWTGAEWLRGHVLTGFPWNLVGYAFADFDAPRQAAAYVGSYGLSFLTVLLAVLPAVFLMAAGRRERIVSASVFVALAAALWGGGELRLRAAAPSASEATLRIVQGNVAQDRKWDPDYRREIIERYVELSARPGTFDLLLWPESAFPGYLAEASEVLARIGATLPAGGALLTGSPDREIRDGAPRYYNAILAVGEGGAVTARYAKHHLVPFGEYVPLRGWLPLERLAAGIGDFSAGTGPGTIDLGSLPSVALAICYEAVFPGHVVDAADRPDWIFNATNDAWFGTSIGPWQHLASARMRAVEEGLPLARAANTGISAVFDSYGRTTATLGLGRTGVLDAPLPPPLERTLYARFGDGLTVLLAAFAGVVAWISTRRAQSSAGGLSRASVRTDRKERS